MDFTSVIVFSDLSDMFSAVIFPVDLGLCVLPMPRYDWVQLILFLLTLNRILRISACV